MNQQNQKDNNSMIKRLQKAASFGQLYGSLTPFDSKELFKDLKKEEMEDLEQKAEQVRQKAIQTAKELGYDPKYWGLGEK